MGFPAKVLSVENIDLPGSLENHEEDECLQVYGLKICTDKGEIVIDYRNSSNGDYGGNLWWPNLEDPEAYNYFYGGVYGQNISNEEWKPLSEVA